MNQDVAESDRELERFKALLHGVTLNLYNAQASLTVLNTHARLLELDIARHNDFLTFCRQQSLILASLSAAKLLDKSKESATLVKLCRFIEQNARHLHGVPDMTVVNLIGSDAFVSNEVKIYAHRFLNHPLSEQLRTLRDKGLAHTDANAILNKQALYYPPVVELEAFIDEVDHFVKLVESKINSTHLVTSVFRESISNSLIHLVAATETCFDYESNGLELQGKINQRVRELTRTISETLS